MKFTISAPALARVQWVMSDCQHSFGRAAWNRMNEDRGRLRGCGVTRPRRRRTRQTELTEGTAPCCRARCQWIVTAPASKPWASRFVRSATICSSRARSIDPGDDFGRLDRRVSPASPSARYRARSLYVLTHLSPMC